MDAPPPTSSGNLKDAIVTLPTWGIGAIGVICIGCLVLAIYLATSSANDSIKGTAVQLLIMLVPLTSAVIAATAMRRSSTRQIDHLVTKFLEQTMLERLQVWVNTPTANPAENAAYPFSAVRLASPTHGKSYAFFEFTWRDDTHPPVIVGIKTNVFNFEVMVNLQLALPDCIASTLKSEHFIVSAANVEAKIKEPLFEKFASTIQGSINEGYEVKIQIRPPLGASGTKTTEMHFSLRQRLRENFLASPFLKRYFAEDAAIVIGVIFDELRNSGWRPENTRESC